MKHNDSSAADYLDYSGRDDILSGGVKMIPVERDLPCLDEADRQPADDEGAAPARWAGRDARVS
jgi:hypothetical protein